MKASSDSLHYTRRISGCQNLDLWECVCVCVCVRAICSDWACSYFPTVLTTKMYVFEYYNRRDKLVIKYCQMSSDTTTKRCYFIFTSVYFDDTCLPLMVTLWIDKMQKSVTIMSISTPTITEQKILVTLFCYVCLLINLCNLDFLVNSLEIKNKLITTLQICDIYWELCNVTWW